MPAVERFDPDLMLISAGFDAHWSDPLANMQLTLEGYDYLARECIGMAERMCDGQIVFVMEGGYDLPALANGWVNIARALLGQDEISDPYGEARSAADASGIQPLIDEAAPHSRALGHHHITFEARTSVAPRPPLPNRASEQTP